MAVACHCRTWQKKHNLTVFYSFYSRARLIIIVIRAAAHLFASRAIHRDDPATA
jgi:hypothetical protein